MKKGLALFALGCAVAATFAASELRAGENDPLEKRLAVSFVRAAGKVTITIKPTDGHAYVNAEFPAKCDLKTDGKIDKPALAKADFKYEDAGKPGKAKSISAVVTADKKIKATCKVVACSDNACSSPFTLEGAE